MGIFDRLRGDQIKIHILIRGRIGDDWKDVDENLRMPAGHDAREARRRRRAAGVPLREALEQLAAPRATR